MTGFVNETNADRPEGDSYSKLIQKINKDGVCPFCPEHLASYHTKPIIEETEHWLATENMNPYINTSEHLLFIHKNHIETVEELSVEAWVDLLSVIKVIVRARKIAGSALLMRNGDTRFTGASVAHLHAQLISGTGDVSDDPVTARVG